MSAHPAWLILAGDGQLGGWVRRTKAQRPVRAVLAVVIHVDAQDLFEMATSQDQ
jgi:hypothetical protein